MHALALAGCVNCDSAPPVQKWLWADAGGNGPSKRRVTLQGRGNVQEAGTLHALARCLLDCELRAGGAEVVRTGAGERTARRGQQSCKAEETGPDMYHDTTCRAEDANP